MRNEMITLIDKLEASHIPYEVTKDIFGSPQVWYPSFENAKCDAICHKYSYGGDKGLLEIMGLLTEEEAECDSVVGYLTANDVFARIYTDYINSAD